MMSSIALRVILFFFATFPSLVGSLTVTAPPYGQLSVSGSRLLGANGQQVALHGNSLYFSMWAGKYWIADSVKAIKCNWNGNVVRAAMGTLYGGYLNDSNSNYNMLKTIVEASIAEGIYVIVDWHIDTPDYVNQAIEFFTRVSSAYGQYPHILYETFNEPQLISWNDVIRPYHLKVIAAIRRNDPNNVIICGTGSWSSQVDIASQNPITNYKNIAYTFHYYAATQSSRTPIETARKNGVLVFVTEYGTCEYTGNGRVDEASANDWWNYLEGLGISYVNWSFSDIPESCSALIPKTPLNRVGSSSYRTQSGKLVAGRLRAQNNGVRC